MCCERCPEFPCSFAVTIHVHEQREGGMPEHHFHFCRSHRLCNFKCEVCGKLVKKWAHLPIAQFQYGCCHRCPDCKTCKDFAQRTVDLSKRLNLWG